MSKRTEEIALKAVRRLVSLALSGTSNEPGRKKTGAILEGRCGNKLESPLFLEPKTVIFPRMVKDDWFCRLPVREKECWEKKDRGQ